MKYHNNYLGEPMQIHFKRWHEIRKAMEMLRLEIEYPRDPHFYGYMQEIYDSIFYPLGIHKSIKYLNSG